MFSRSVKIAVAATGAALLGIGATVAYLGSQGDRDITFVREVETELDSATLGRSLHVLHNWAHWHHMAADAQALNFRLEPFAYSEQYVSAGAKIRIGVEPRKQKWRRYELTFIAFRYEKDRLIELRLLTDSTERVTRMFENVRWTIELLPAPPGSPPEAKTRIRGTLTARTRSWRSRVLTTLAERILAHQLFLPDLEALGRLTRPQSLVPPQALRY